MYLVHIAEKDLLKNKGLKIAKTGIENTIILIGPNSGKNIDILRKIDLLSSINIFENLNLNNLRSLIDCLQQEEFYSVIWCSINFREITLSRKGRWGLSST